MQSHHLLSLVRGPKQEWRLSLVICPYLQKELAMEERHTNEHICSLELCSQEKYTSIVTRNPEYSSNKLWLIFPVFFIFLLLHDEKVIRLRCRVVLASLYSSVLIRTGRH
jgi:hypothetical protein